MKVVEKIAKRLKEDLLLITIFDKESLEIDFGLTNEEIETSLRIK